ncbi:unnamed protein product [marine sediment metagenome]|uniref:50S ribosomal protein L29 n=1 Tax=marine sediment metagenome TaxID=412755 RepID=X0STD5_9ZZZZ
MEGKLTWNGMKKELWKMNPNELQKKLQELETEKMKMEMKARGYSGDMGVPMSINRIADQKGNPTNLKNIRHRIAFIKNVLNIKR